MSTTGAFMIAMLIAVLGMNVWWFFDAIPRTTISAHIVAGAALSVLVPGFYGVLGGHWFMPSRWSAPGGFWIMAGLAVALITIEVVTGWWLARHTHPIQWVLIWLALGPTLWPMGDTPA